MLHSSKRSKPALLIRLSNLIILQVFFIFAALALILLYPVDKGHNQENGTGLALLAETIYPSLESTRSGTGPLAKGSVDSLFQHSEYVVARIYSLPEGALETAILYEYIREKGNDSPDLSLFETVNSNALRFVAAQEPGYSVSRDLDHNYTLNYTRLSRVGENLLIMVTVVRHGWFVSSKREIMYALGLLFLASTLISLLTIYLVQCRIKNPTDQLMRGFERIAKGDAVEISEPQSQEVFDQLISSFNEMSRQLQKNRCELTSYNVRLKKANTSLANSQVFLSTVIHSSPDSIVVADSKGVILLANQQALEEFGVEESGMLRKNVSDFLSITTEKSLQSYDSCSILTGEAICQRKDGESFPAYVVECIVPTGDDSKELLLYHIDNISESREFQEMVIRLDRLCTRGDMAGDIAHDMNNFLAILSGNLELLPIMLRKGDQEKIDKRLLLMRETIDRITQFASELMEGDNDDSQMQICSLNQTVQNVLTFLRQQKKYENLRLDLDLDSNLPLLQADRSQIQQLIMNLVCNAADSLTENESGIVTIVTRQEMRENIPVEVIEISDNGPGVVEEKVGILFQQRFTTRRKGHGLGLITCRKIAESHGGTISYRYSDGAVFSVEIPISNPDSSSGSRTAGKLATASSN